MQLCATFHTPSSATLYNRLLVQSSSNPHPAQQATSLRIYRSANALRPAAERGVRFQQNSRTTPHIHNNNNYQNKTFHNLNNITVAPPASYRTLKPEVRHILQTRNPKTRGMLEHELHHTNPVVEPPVRPMRPVTPVPEPEPEEPVEGEEGEGGVDGGLLEMPPATVDEPVPEAAPKKELIIEAPASDNNKTVARYNARTGTCALLYSSLNHPLSIHPTFMSQYPSMRHYLPPYNPLIPHFLAPCGFRLLHRPLPINRLVSPSRAKKHVVLSCPVFYPFSLVFGCFPCVFGVFHVIAADVHCF